MTDPEPSIGEPRHRPDPADAWQSVDATPPLPEPALAVDVLRAPVLEAPPAEPVPPFADGSYHRLHPSYVTTERIGSVIFCSMLFLGGLITFLVFLIADGLAGLRPWLILLGAILVPGALLVLGFVLSRKSYEHTSYALSPLGMEIRRGIWWKHVIDVPRSRIQHTDVQQGPLARWFGLGKLVVYTSGTQHSSVELDGLEHGRAMQIRDFLIKGGADDGV